jgi:EAL domain-containing protein (putative c-di-GMP-specific phosphodiesterase class I)/CheY-like chemotaxis protein
MPANKLTTSKRRLRLLLVEDDLDAAAFFVAAADVEGYDVDHVDTPRGVREAWAACRPDLVMLDLRLREGDGIEVLRWLGEQRSRVPVVLMSGTDRRLLDAASAIAASRGVVVVDVLRKPAPAERVRAILQSHRADHLGPERLRQALRDDEVVPWFQPIVQLDSPTSWSLVGVEALARWVHPVRGVLTPDAFLHLAESAEDMATLTLAILRRTAAVLPAWRAAGIDVWASVNLAPLLLRDLSWPDRIGTIWAEARNPAQRLVLEITEDGLMADPDLAREILARFRLKGFGLALDDFGSGYSSLQQLYRLPFDHLKIDRAFVADLETSEEARTIVRCLVELGRGLGLSVCAEGVETLSALEFLWDLGCRTAQGWLFARPVPADELPDLCDAAGWRDGPETR